MPRKVQWPPSYLHHRASGQAYLRWQGVIYYLGVHDSPESRELYARRMVEIQAGNVPAKAAEADRLTVGVVVGLGLDLVSPRVSAKEAKQYDLSVKPLLALYGSLPAAQFGVSELEAVQASMAGTLCRNVTNRRIARIKTLWRACELKRLVPPGSWAGLRSLPGLAINNRHVRHTKRREPATWEQLMRVVKEARKMRKLFARGRENPIATMLLLQWWTGMRSQEVRLVRPCDIDQTGQLWSYRPTAHKGSWRPNAAERVIVLGPKCQTLLRRWLAAAETPDDFVFRTKRRKCYSDSSYAQAVAIAADRAGLPNFQAYQLRHAAKQRLTREFGLDAARCILGQKSLDSANHYAAAQDLVQALKIAKDAC